MLKAAPAGKLASTYQQKSLQRKLFTPSSVAIREHRKRERADRIIDQFVQRFTEKDFFPDDSDSALFALLVQLPEWPADLSIRILDDAGEAIAIYLKGSDESVVRHSVVLTESGDKEYTAPGDIPVAEEEALMVLLFQQLGVGSRLGLGGDFPGSNSIAGRIVTLREQLAGLGQSNRTMLFDALVADDCTFKHQSPNRLPNPFLPLWRRVHSESSPVLSVLQALCPEVPVGRFEELLERMPLSREQESEALETLSFPESFNEALMLSLDEWNDSVAIDGLARPRAYNPRTDRLAGQCARDLLESALNRELVIIDPGMGPYEPSGDDDTHVVLLHDGVGNYSALDLRNGEINVGSGTDSFYLAISWLLQPHERSLIGMQAQDDVSGFRETLTRLAIHNNGGWFNPESPTEVDSAFLPDWFRDATLSDKADWKTAVLDYSQALLEAQAPDLIGPAGFDEPEQLRSYARDKLAERIETDFGVVVNPDEVIVETIHSEIVVEGFVDIDYVYAGPTEAEHYYTVERRSLTELSLANVALTDINFWLTSRAFDSQGRLLGFLSAGYMRALVRELNVGEHYSAFLQATLLNSSAGRWHQERYARVMQAQMRLDAIEAKMAGDFDEAGALPGHLADRGYKWVSTVLDQPVDDDRRAKVEGHSVRVNQLAINDVPLNTLLVIGTSLSSIASLVIFTPQAPDGRCFRELSGLDDVRQSFLLEPALLDYFLKLAPVAAQSDLRRVLTVAQHTLHMELKPCTGNFFDAVYEAEVDRLLDAVDEQTTSTLETTWESAWEITKAVGEIVLTFAPFKVNMPVAAVRSAYAVWQGVEETIAQGGDAPLYFVQASLLLADGLTSANGLRVKPATVKAARLSDLSPKKALGRMPAELKLRNDGVYRGVHESAQEGSETRFYAVQAEKAYAIRYDADMATWRVGDARRPDAYYQMPIHLSDQGVWEYASVGLRGGKRPKPGKASKANGDGSSGETRSTASKRPTLDMQGFFQSSAFKKAEGSVNGDLRVAVNKAVERYVLDGKGALHKSFAGLWSLDLPGIGGSKGRGAWRLFFEPPQKGIMKAHSIGDPH